jgi:hypothetical protein
MYKDFLLQEFLNILNEYRTSLPSRLSHVAPPADSAVREGAALARRRHSDLAARAQRLQDRLRGAALLSRQYDLALERAGKWINEVSTSTHIYLFKVHQKNTYLKKKTKLRQPK